VKQNTLSSSHDKENMVANKRNKPIAEKTKQTDSMNNSPVKKNKIMNNYEEEDYAEDEFEKFNEDGTPLKPKR